MVRENIPLLSVMTPSVQRADALRLLREAADQVISGPPERCHNHENRQDSWKPAIKLDEESTIVVREPDAATQLAPQNNHLMSELLSLKPDLRLEQRGQGG
jgi:hypothetical protein